MTDKLHFCTSCFATSEDGSGGGTAHADYCTNCGSGGSSILIPAWAVTEIRRTASWVGKRYYPDREDFEISAELKKLRLAQQEYPGRSATPLTDSGWFNVSQKTPSGSISTVVKAGTVHEALDLTKGSLPYFTAEELSQVQS